MPWKKRDVECYTLTELADRVGETRQKVSRRLRPIKPFDKRGKYDLYTVQQYCQACETYVASQTNETEAELKIRKLQEEIRTKQLANDEKESLLISRAWVADTIIKVFGQTRESLKKHLLETQPAQAEMQRTDHIRAINQKIFDDLMKQMKQIGRLLEVRIEK